MSSPGSNFQKVKEVNASVNKTIKKLLDGGDSEIITISRNDLNTILRLNNILDMSVDYLLTLSN